MAFTQAQLDVLEAAIASGTLTVEYDGRRVTYRSMAELERARDLVRRGLGASDGAQRRFATFSKGL